MRFGENLKEIRKIKKISQEKLAQMLGVSRQSVSKWECGDAYPEMKHILALCELFSCNINDLVHNDMSDIQLMDEDVQQSVVKFKREKQAKVQLICKIIEIISYIWKYSSLICIPAIIILMIVLPTTLEMIDLADLMLEVDFQEFLTWNKTAQFFIIEYIMFDGLINVVLSYKAAKLIIKLCKNIYQGSTPFTLKNVDTIKKLSLYISLLIIIEIVSKIFLNSLRAKRLIFSFNLFAILFILFLLLVSNLFEYGYELQLDTKYQMIGEVSNEEETTSTKVLEYLNNNIKPFVNKIGWISVGAAVIFGIYMISSAFYEKIINFDPQSLIQQPVLLQLEDLGYKETDVLQSKLYENKDYQCYELIIDSAKDNLPTNHYIQMRVYIYDFNTNEKAKTFLLGQMTNAKKFVEVDISSKKLDYDDLDYISAQNITEYMIQLDKEKWNVEEAYALFNDETYPYNFSSTQHIYLLKENRLLILQYNHYLTFDDEQMNVLSKLIDESNEIFK